MSKSKARKAAITLQLTARSMIISLNEALQERKSPEFDEDLFAEMQALLSDRKLLAKEVFVKSSFPYAMRMVWDRAFRALGIPVSRADLDLAVDEEKSLDERIRVMERLLRFFRGMEANMANFGGA